MAKISTRPTKTKGWFWVHPGFKGGVWRQMSKADIKRIFKMDVK